MEAWHWKRELKAAEVHLETIKAADMWNSLGLGYMPQLRLRLSRKFSG